MTARKLHTTMKIAGIFLLATLVSSFDLSTGTIQNACLQQLLKNDAPQFIQDLGNLLCKYQLAKTSQNQQLFMEFLDGVNKLLGDVGCTLDSLLGIRVVPTIDNCEEIADQVADILFSFLKSLPSLVSDIVNTLVPEVGALLNVLDHIQDVKNVACDVLEDILPKVADILSIGGEILDRILNDLDLAETKPVHPVV
ncbi:hypothetical protein GDO81_010549 [Engystomops pustulosus]|uniref:Secreted protein n=1 Tax=Engystomops pustulosus TaxID=76066 RepID=A0AAV7C0U9_ENGPU|nr:hypothetical protein GDO81_010549 [Engystomops pustulosus]